MIVLCLTIPLELSQIAFTIVGAAAYAMFQSTHILERTAKLSTDKVARAAHSSAVAGEHKQGPRPKGGSSSIKSAGGLLLRRPGGKVPPRGPPPPPVVPAGREYRQASSQPVGTPNFAATDFEAEVDELVSQISPSDESNAVVGRLASSVQSILRTMIPEVEVMGFASGDLLRGTAFGVAVPEVDIVVNASPQVLAACTPPRTLPHGNAGATSSSGTAYLDMRQLQKSVIRACTDKLVATGGFKFRRSAFRGQEPKVTLLAHSTLGIYSESIPLDFSVNSTMPLQNAALLTECGLMQPRAKSLILFVKRWAKDRGVCHAAKGHLSPFAWTLLTIYFLQVGDEDGPLLPPLEGFLKSSGLAGPRSQGAPAAGQGAGTTPAVARVSWAPLAPDAPQKSVGALLKGFFHFYNKVFDWRGEAVSVRRGRRASPDLTLPLHIVVNEDGVTTQVGPSIEHPFEQKRNIGDCATAVSLARLREEFSRAEDLCNKPDVSLSTVLEPWVPPERGVGPCSGLRDDENGAEA